MLGVATQPVSWASLAVLIGGGAGVLAYWNFVREREKTKGAVVWWPACCRVGVHAADFVGPDAAVAHKVTSYGKPALGGPFELVNQRGEPVTDASYQGEYLLLYFGFTYCPDICPSELVKMGKVVEQLGTIDIPAHAPALRRSRGGHSQMARKASRRCARCSFPSTLTETPSLKWRRMCKVRWLQLGTLRLRAHFPSLFSRRCATTRLPPSVRSPHWDTAANRQGGQALPRVLQRCGPRGRRRRLRRYVTMTVRTCRVVMNADTAARTHQWITPSSCTSWRPTGTSWSFSRSWRSQTKSWRRWASTCAREQALGLAPSDCRIAWRECEGVERAA